MSDLSPAVFDDSVQLVRMGALYGNVLHLRYAGETTTEDVTLTDDEARLLRQLDPTKFEHTYRPAERASLLDMAERGLLRIVLPGSGFGAYDWAVEITTPIHILPNPFDGGFMCLAGGASFNLVDLGHPLLTRMDGVRTIGDITDEYQNEVLSRPNGRQVLADALEKTKRPFYVLLCDAGMSLTKGLLDTGAGHCLPLRRPAEDE